MPDVRLKLTPANKRDIKAAFRNAGKGDSDVLWSRTVDLGDDLEADIEIVDGDPEPYTQAVLFENGHEVAHTQPGEDNSIIGEWEFSQGDEVYRIIVE